MPSTVAAVRKPKPGVAILTETTTEGVGEIIRAIAEVTTRAGGNIDAGLVAVELDGHVGLGTRIGNEGDRFITLPEQVLIPVNELTWTDASDVVQLESGGEFLTEIQRELLDLHIELWNSTQKLEAFRATHPRAAAMTDSALTEAITAIRSNFTPGNSTRDLLRTRTFGLGAGKEARSVVMPILELADHHPHGSPYYFAESDLSANYQFVDDSGGVYVSYGPCRDSIDLACLYGFATDTTTSFVSAPMSLDLGDFGTLRIERSVNRRSRAQWRADDESLSVDYLVLDAYVGLFDALCQPIREFLLERGASRSQSLALAIDAVGTIIHVNIQRVTSIADTAERSPHGGAAVIAAAARHQLSVIDVVGERA